MTYNGLNTGSYIVIPVSLLEETAIRSYSLLYQNWMMLYNSMISFLYEES